MKRGLELFRVEAQPIYSPLFIACFLLFIIHQVTQRILNISIPIADNYLDNLLAAPILLSLLLLERRIIFKYGKEYTLSLAEAIWATALISVVGELIFPVFTEEFTSDWLDVLFYFLGCILFYTLSNRVVKSKNPSQKKI